MTSKEIASIAKGRYKILFGTLKEVMRNNEEFEEESLKPGFIFTYEELGRFVIALKEEWGRQNGTQPKAKGLQA